MKRILFFAFIVFIVTCSSSYAFVQTPTLTGATGLVRMPTGDVPPAKNWNIGLDYIFDSPGTGTVTNLTDLRGSFSYKANMVADMGHDKGMEVGFVGRTEKTTNRFKEGVLINLKYSLSSSNDPDALFMAIGAENLTSTSESDIYIVASKYFNGGFGIHFGALFDFPNGSRIRPLGMLGVNFPLINENLTIMGEAFSGESVFQVNAGLRYSVTRSFALLARALNVTNSSSARDTQSYAAGVCLLTPF